MTKTKQTFIIDLNKHRGEPACPRCLKILPILRGEDEEGLSSNRFGSIFWNVKKNERRLPWYSEAIVGGRFTWWAANLEAYRCPKCKIAVFSYEKEPKSDIKLHKTSLETAEELYEQLLDLYTRFYGGGRQVLEREIESYMKEGYSRDEAIQTIARKNL